MHNAKEAKNLEEDWNLQGKAILADHPPYREVYKLPSRQFNDHYLA